jgi:hypothetical protein
MVQVFWAGRVAQLVEHLPSKWVNFLSLRSCSKLFSGTWGCCFVVECLSSILWNCTILTGELCGVRILFHNADVKNNNIEYRGLCCCGHYTVLQMALLFFLSFFLQIFLFCSSRFDLRASYLLGSCSTTWATLPALFCVECFWDGGLTFILSSLASNRDPPDLCFLIS